ncbi:MAG: M48 family metallopeptidase [Thermoplasmata archaeon]
MISKNDFKNEVIFLAKEVGVEPKEIHIRKMKRKWASCSSKGRLTFDYALLEEPINERYRKILHELLHLKYPNHGKMFNMMLETYLRKILREHQTTTGNIK